MNNTTEGLKWRCGTMKIMRARGMKPGWLLLVPALLMVAAGAIAFAQNPPVSHDSSQIIQFLNQTIDWYRHVTAVQQTATEPDDFILVSDNGRMANQVVRLAFDFARAETQGIAKQGTSGADQTRVSSKVLVRALSSVGRQIRQTNPGRSNRGGVASAEAGNGDGQKAPATAVPTCGIGGGT